jgi:uncharacterized protein
VEFVAHRVPPGRQEIQAYGRGGFTISGSRYQGSVIVSLEQVWPIALDAIAAARIELLAPLFAAGIEIDLLLLGSGARFLLPPPELVRELRARGIAVEAMTTAAACRTFNLLATEERRIAALLVALP